MKKKRVFIIISVLACVLVGVVLILKLQNEGSNRVVSNKEEQHVQEDAIQNSDIKEEQTQEEQEDIEEHVVQEETTTQQNVTQDHSSEADVAEQNEEQKTPVSSEEPTVSEQPVTSTPMNEVKETPTEKINTGTLSVATHTPVAEQSYYQYASLNDTGKAIYRVIVQAIKNSDTLVNLNDYSCSPDTIAKIYECIMADYPQFFYIAKNSSYICDSEEQTVKEFIVMYTDGTTTDQYNETGERIVTANRSTISQQVANFNSKVSGVLATISSSGSALEKEKKIYDFIQSNVAYNTQAATLIHSPEGMQIPHDFDAYGALCEGHAVCEGYAKLFQYLCYCVGITSTQIYGSSSNQPHMWNAVNIDNEWYMCDVTWDDCGRDDLHCYNYFNITTNQMTGDHTIDTAYLQVPSCNSDGSAFYNHYALYISDISAPPSNYQKVIDCLAQNGDKYLCIYIGNQSGIEEEYLASQILSSDSAIQQYISSMNYAIVLDNQYITAGNYGYIPLK